MCSIRQPVANFLSEIRFDHILINRKEYRALCMIIQIFGAHKVNKSERSQTMYRKSINIMDHYTYCRYVNKINQHLFHLHCVVIPQCWRGLSVDRELCSRVAKFSAACEWLDHRVWKNHSLKMETKFIVYKAMGLSTLLYGSET